MARQYYNEAIALRPDYADAYSERGNLDVLDGKPGEALDDYGRALRIDPDHGKALHNLGTVLWKSGYNAEAIVCLRRAVELDPSFVRSRFFLGQALLKGGLAEEAIQQLEVVARRETDRSTRVAALCAIGDADRVLGRPREALNIYEAALLEEPECGPALIGLSSLLSTDGDPSIRNGGKAVSLAERAVLVENSSPEALDVLAAAYAEIGDFPRAIETGTRAAAAARSVHQDSLASLIEARVREYRSGRAWRR